MTKNQTLIIVAVLCATVTLLGAWFMRTHPPAKIPKERTPQLIEVYRDCVTSVPDKEADCRAILEHNEHIRAKRAAHQKALLALCMEIEKQGLNLDGTNSCARTAQIFAGQY